MLNKYFNNNEATFYRGLSALTIYLIKSTTLTLLLIAFAYALILAGFSVPVVYSQYIGVFNLLEVSSQLFFVAYAVITLFIIPYCVATFIFKIKPVDIGVVFPKLNTENLVLTMMAILLLVPFGYLFSTVPSIRAQYYFVDMSLLDFLMMQFILLPVYYLAEEFFFRGFLFFILWRRVGWHSFWIVDIMFVFAHCTKPLPEIILCIPASIVLSYIALKSKSFYPAFLVHAALGFYLNWMVYFY